MLRHEGCSTPYDLHILRAHGDSIEFPVEAVSSSDPAELRLTSPNPVYEPYAVSEHDLHMVVWVIEKGR